MTTSRYHCSKCDLGFSKETQWTRHSRECVGKVNIVEWNTSITLPSGKHEVTRSWYILKGVKA
jgi:hypothetical protein